MLSTCGWKQLYKDNMLATRDVIRLKVDNEQNKFINVVKL